MTWANYVLQIINSKWLLLFFNLIRMVKSIRNIIILLQQWELQFCLVYSLFRMFIFSSLKLRLMRKTNSLSSHEVFTLIQGPKRRAKKAEREREKYRDSKRTEYIGAAHIRRLQRHYIEHLRYHGTKSLLVLLVRLTTHLSCSIWQSIVNWASAINSTSRQPISDKCGHPPQYGKEEPS